MSSVLVRRACTFLARGRRPGRREVHPPLIQLSRIPVESCRAGVSLGSPPDKPVAFATGAGSQATHPFNPLSRARQPTACERPHQGLAGHAVSPQERRHATTCGEVRTRTPGARGPERLRCWQAVAGGGLFGVERPAQDPLQTRLIGTTIAIITHGGSMNRASTTSSRVLVSGAQAVSLAACVVCGAVVHAAHPGEGQAIQDPAMKRATISIRGRVTVADSGIPVRSAQVALSDGNLVVRMALTGADGRYEFSSLMPGRYRLAFSKAGFVSQKYGAARPVRHRRGDRAKGGQSARTC